MTPEQRKERSEADAARPVKSLPVPHEMALVLNDLMAKAASLHAEVEQTDAMVNRLLTALLIDGGNTPERIDPKNLQFAQNRQTGEWVILYQTVEG